MRFNLFLCQLCAGVALLKCVCVCVFFPSQNALPDTQAKFHILFLFFSASMFSVSLASLFIYHCWLVCKNRSTLGRWRPPHPHACVCVFWVLTQCLQSLSWTPALCFLGICLLCLHSVIFALMMKDAVWLPPPPFSICHHSHQHTALMSLFGLLSDRGVSHYVCTVAHFVPVHGREWIIQRSMLQCNAKTQGWEQ